MMVRGVWEFWKEVFIDWNILFSLIGLLMVCFVWNFLSNILSGGVYKVIIEDGVGIWIVFFWGVE